MEKLRVLHIISGLGDGGAQRIVLNYLRDFKEDENIDVSLLTLNNNINPKYKEEIIANNYQITCINNNSKKSAFLLKIMNYIIIQKKIDKVLKEIKPDIVHVHLCGTMIFALNAVIKNKVPIRLYTLHSNPLRFKGNHLKTLKKAFSKGKFIAICVTNEQAKLAKNYYGFNKYEVVHNGVDFENVKKQITDKQTAREKFGFNSNEFIICAVGRLNKIKQFDFLIKVFSHIVKYKNDVKLVIAGDGEELDNLKQLAYQLKIDNKILFLGNVNDIIGLYCASDVLAVTSKSESSSLVLLEAQACNTRCVISDGVPSESIITNKVKKMKENASEEDWAEALLDNNFEGKKICDFDDYEVHSVSNVMKDIYLKYWEEFNSEKKQ